MFGTKSGTFAIVRTGAVAAAAQTLARFLQATATCIVTFWHSFDFLVGVQDLQYWSTYVWMSLTWKFRLAWGTVAPWAASGPGQALQQVTWWVSVSQICNANSKFNESPSSCRNHSNIAWPSYQIKIPCVSSNVNLRQFWPCFIYKIIWKYFIIIFFFLQLSYFFLLSIATSHFSTQIPVFKLCRTTAGSSFSLCCA